MTLAASPNEDRTPALVEGRHGRRFSPIRGRRELFDGRSPWRGDIRMQGIIPNTDRRYSLRRLLCRSIR